MSRFPKVVPVIQSGVRRERRFRSFAVYFRNLPPRFLPKRNNDESFSLCE